MNHPASPRVARRQVASRKGQFPISPPGQETEPGLVVLPVHTSRDRISTRCSVKGCIFPAAGQSENRCLVHDLAEKEPKLFLSVQPSILLLDQAKFGIPDADYDDSRARDRRRLAALREEFREEVA